ncbi:hypothetical protein LJR029_003944 [Caballeronia sp. LjRoot29]|uniref:hypothetical protein n=1 Tax=Caballeronia sp. LjRoot29 TaxID=3342315 RepID=UPI003ECFAF04
MSAFPSGSDDTKSPTALSQQQKDALIGELLGDVLTLHKSVKDLSSIVSDTDQRLATRVVELRAISSELSHAREAAFAQIALQARTQAQEAFKESMGALLGKLENTLQDVPRTAAEMSQRRFLELLVVAVATGAITLAGTLAGVWMMFR